MQVNGKMAWDDAETNDVSNKTEDATKTEEQKEETKIIQPIVPNQPAMPPAIPVDDTIIQIKAQGQRAFELMEAEDEKQIVNAELFEESVKALVYTPTQGPMTLTITGVFEAARRYKNIQFGIISSEKTQDGWLVKAWARNLADNIYNEAIVEQPFRIPMGQQGLVKDPFALQKAQSKAKRNAVRQVIPINYFYAMLKRFLEERANKKTPNIIQKK